MWTRIILLSVLVFVSACQSKPADVSDSQDTKAEAAAQLEPEAGEQSADSAFMINEAEKPINWPEPTPIGVVQVKTYPAYRAAIVREEQSDRGDQNSMFRTLFNHIKQNDIAMTSPVEMTYDPDTLEDDADGNTRPVAMAFLYREPDMGQLGEQGKVEVRDMPEQTVLSIGVRGNYNAAGFEMAMKQLNEYLSEYADRYIPAGPPRYLGYNSPFVPFFLKYGEVQLPVHVTSVVP